MSTAAERKQLRALADRLASVESLCHAARLKMAGGNFSAWTRDEQQLSAIADLLVDAGEDLKAVQDVIERFQIAAETR